MDKAQELADAHWSYIEALLIQHGEDKHNIEIIGWHYRTSFVHGFKHGQQAYDDKLKGVYHA